MGKSKIVCHVVKSSLDIGYFSISIHSTSGSKPPESPSNLHTLQTHRGWPCKLAWQDLLWRGTNNTASKCVLPLTFQL